MGTKIDSNFIVDTSLQLHDGTLIAADGAGSGGILNLGVGEVTGLVVIDATAVEVASGDEIYYIGLEFSSSATFASAVHPGPFIGIGNNGIADSLLDNGSADRGVGRYTLPFNNVVNGTAYQYCRLYVHVAGTIATGIAFTAYITNPRY